MYQHVSGLTSLFCNAAETPKSHFDTNTHTTALQNLEFDVTTPSLREMGVGKYEMLTLLVHSHVVPWCPTASCFPARRIATMHTDVGEW
jgi:hypothetical protein